MSDATERVRALVERCVEAIEDGRRDDITTLLASNADVEREVRGQLDVLERSGLLDAPGSSPAVPERLGEFRLIRQLGRGGMGVVYLAEQERLNRTVALKLMHPEFVFFPNARERFEREVQAAARLQHVGIVPVHTFGEADGVPFYAMERVVGASLAEVIAQVAGTACERLDASWLRQALARALAEKGEDATVADVPLFTGTWVRACCRIVRDVARALQHAHEHGVLHRDLKPSNILLDAAGQVLLIDFGLAVAHGDERITRTGAMLGSLPYMAPEQIRGESDAIDERTDVYALGVTLYELLTLTLPYGSGAGETHSRILGGSVEPLTRRNPIVHPDAEAICLQAMDPVRTRRYASAGELADDLERFVELRPVRARRQTTWSRAHRFVVRHPARAVAIGLAVLLAVGGPTAFAWQQHLANVRIQSALDDANREHDLADYYLDRALAAVDRMLSRTASSRLKNVPRTARLRQQLLQDALEFQLELADREPGQTRVLAEGARARRRVGEIRLDLGAIADGMADLERAIAELTALRDADPTAGSVQLEIARARVALSRAYWSSGGVGPYCDALRAAIGDFEAVLARVPGDLAVELELARTRISLASGLARSRDYEGAADELDRVDRVLGTAPPAELEPDQRMSWFVTYGRSADARGVVSAYAGDTARAGREFQRAAERFGAAAAEAVDSPDAVVAELAGVRTRAAFLLHQTRDWETALPAIDAAVAQLTKLIDDEPDDATWWGQLATLLSTRGDIHTQLRDFVAARADFDAATARIDEAIQRFPEDIGHLRARAIVHAEFAAWCRRQGDRAAARTQFLAAIAGFRAFAAAAPNDEQAKANLVAALANSANAFAEWGDDDESREMLGEAVVLARARRGGEADRSLIEVLCLAASRAQIDGDPARARALIGESRTRAETWLAAAPDDALRLGAIATVAIEAAAIELSLGAPESAVDVLVAAEASAVRGAATGKAANRLGLATLLLRRADAERACGRIEVARQCFRRAVDEAGASRESMADVPSLAALFDDPDFAVDRSRR